MPRQPPPQPIDVTLVEAAVRPPLAALGVEHLEIVVGGTPERVELIIGYRLRPDTTRPQRELLDAASAVMPASVDYSSLRVCRVEDMPLTEPELIAARRRIRGGPWRLRLVVAGGAVVLVVLALGLFGRGKLVARAGLYRGVATSEAHFRGGEALVLWASLNGTWRGLSGASVSRSMRQVMPVRYAIDFLQGGRVVKQLSVDTRQPRPLTLVCTVAPDCEVLLVAVPTLPPGLVQMRVTARPREDVTEVVDMSLNVRRAGIF